MRRIIGLVVLVLIGFAIYYGYTTYRTKKNLDDGAVTGTGLMTPEQKTRFDAENRGDGPDGNSERKHETVQQPVGETSSNPEASANGGNTAANQPVNSSMTMGTPVEAASQTAVQGPAPVSDTVKPNPTNGMVFAGTGTYQWYRQGNLTWRVNTTTGSSCIVYATMDEWRKSIVLHHGCGSSV